MKKIIKYLIVLLLCVVFQINGVKAKSYINDLFQAGSNVKLNKKLSGTAFLAGNEIKVNEKVDGIVFAAGNNLKINSEEDYVFGAGSNIVLTNDINKDLFLAAESIEIRESNLKRDAYLMANEVSVNATVDRNIYIAASKVTLNGVYNGNITISADNIVLEKGVVINGQIKYNEKALIKGLDTGVKTKTYKTTEKKEVIKNNLVNLFNSYLHIMILSVIFIYLFENVFKKISKNTKDLTINKMITTCGKGFLILIGVPILAFMFLLSGLFVSVGAILGLVYGISVYISTIISAYIFMEKINDKYLKKDMNTYYLAIFGLLAIYILKLVPIIGGFISFVSLIFGLGITGNMIIEQKK